MYSSFYIKVISLIFYLKDDKLLNYTISADKRVVTRHSFWLSQSLTIRLELNRATGHDMSDGQCVRKANVGRNKQILSEAY